MALRDRYVRYVQGEMTTAATADMVGMMNAALVRHGEAVSGVFEFVAKTFGDLQGSDPGLFQNAHRDVGASALRSAQQGFRSRRFRRPAGSYRVGQDRLSGRLTSALNNPGHVRATSTTLEVINQGLLDREAAHWRRLNFGAGQGSREGLHAPASFPINWAGVAVGVLALDADPSPAFTVPRGYWIPGGESGNSANPGRLGLDQFFLSGRRATEEVPGRPSMVKGMGIRGRASGPVRRGTKGIASSNFLDAGVRRVANELPRAYATIYDDLFLRSKPTLEALGRTYGAKVVTPSQQNIRFNYNRSRAGGR